VLKTLLKKNKKKLFFSLLHFFFCADMRNNFLKIKKKYYFYAFPSEKQFEKQSLQYSQTLLKHENNQKKHF
jgi:hypothetical protein